MGQILSRGRSLSVYGRFVRRLPKPCGQKTGNALDQTASLLETAASLVHRSGCFDQFQKDELLADLAALPRGVSKSHWLGTGRLARLGLSPAVVNLLRDAKDLFLKRRSLREARGSERPRRGSGHRVGRRGLRRTQPDAVLPVEGPQRRNLPFRSFYLFAAIETKRVGRHGAIDFRLQMPIGERHPAVSLPAFACCFLRPYCSSHG